MSFSLIPRACVRAKNVLISWNVLRPQNSDVRMSLVLFSNYFLKIQRMDLIKMQSLFQNSS